MNWTFDVAEHGLHDYMSSGGELVAIPLADIDLIHKAKHYQSLASVLTIAMKESPTLPRKPLTGVVCAGGYVTAADMVWHKAWGYIEGLLIAYVPEGAGDEDSIPLVCLEAKGTVGGGDLTLTFDKEGFWKLDSDQTPIEAIFESVIESMKV